MFESPAQKKQAEAKYVATWMTPAESNKVALSAVFHQISKAQYVKEAVQTTLSQEGDIDSMLRVIASRAFTTFKRLQKTGKLKKGKAGFIKEFENGLKRRKLAPAHIIQIVSKANTMIKESKYNVK